MAHAGGMAYAPDIKKIPAAALTSPDADQLRRMLEIADEPIVVRLKMSPKHEGKSESGNVIGEIPGSEHPEQIVLVGGHLDSWDLGTGAIDDASGIGIATGAAKILMDRYGQPKRTIRVVMFGSEETGLWGGAAYAKEHADTLDNHVLAAESDFGAGRIWKISPNVAPEKLPITDAMARDLVVFGVGPGGNDGEGSDLGDIHKAGVPLMGLHQDGSDYFDLHHTSDDTFDKIDPDALAQNVAVYAYVAWVAANIEDDFRPETEAETGAEASE